MTDAAELKLILDPEDRTLARRILRAFAPHCEAWVFGSRATGRNVRKSSDLDIALLSDPPMDWSDLEDLRDLFSASNLRMRVDLVAPAAADCAQKCGERAVACAASTPTTSPRRKPTERAARRRRGCARRNATTPAKQKTARAAAPECVKESPKPKPLVPSSPEAARSPELTPNPPNSSCCRVPRRHAWLAAPAAIHMLPQQPSKQTA